MTGEKDAIHEVTEMVMLLVVHGIHVVAVAELELVLLVLVALMTQVEVIMR